jgi:hypothetical protein
MIVMKQIPENKYDKIYKYHTISFHGESFLVNAEKLVYESYRHSYREIAQYLALASMRPYSDYLTTGELSLDLRKIEIDMEFWEENSLLYINDGKLHFLYEEVTKEKH